MHADFEFFLCGVLSTGCDFRISRINVEQQCQILHGTYSQEQIDNKNPIYFTPNNIAPLYNYRPKDRYLVLEIIEDVWYNVNPHSRILVPSGKPLDLQVQQIHDVWDFLMILQTFSFNWSAASDPRINAAGSEQLFQIHCLEFLGISFGAIKC